MKQQHMYTKLSVLALSITLLFTGCSEFIERSLEKQAVNLLSPSNNIETSSYQLTFVWEANRDALRYRLQIVTKSFDNIEKMLLDTVVRTDKFTFTLDPGTYQWRLRAENGSSQTPYQTRSFKIYPSSLTDQTVQVNSPANSVFTAVPDIEYEWLTLFGATQYRLQVDKNNFINENNLVVNQVVAGNKLVDKLTSEGTFQFRIRAENLTENSKWSTVRNLTYDATPPIKVVLVSPVNKQTVPGPVRLSWNTIIDADKYELIVYKSDGTTPYSASYPMLLTTNSFIFSAGISMENVLWRVRAIDRTGNKGEFSDLYSFTIQ